MKKVVLFACVENTFRSQIAEAYFNKYAPEGWEAISAGVSPAKEVNPNAVKLMLEEGIDIRKQKPKPLTIDLQRMITIGVVVCGEFSCPVILADYVEKWDIPDPAKMKIEDARKIRDEIKKRVLDLIDRIKNGKIPLKARQKIPSE